MRCIVVVLFLFAVPAIAQDIKTVDDYCIMISQKVDDMDKLDDKVKAVIPDLPAAERPKVVEYLKSLSTLRVAIRHDACDAKDLKSAKAATNRDLQKSAALTNEMIEYAKHSLAESYRKKAQSEGGSTAQK
jgi:hypothetical protein